MPRLIDHGLRDGKKAKKAKSKKQPDKPKGKNGRPTSYTEAMGREICERLAEGESLRSICNDPRMPPRRTVRRWAADECHELSATYARAREAGYHELAEELLEIADDGRNDFLQKRKKDGDVILVDHDHISRSRLRIDTRKWYLSKVLPKIYGDNFTLKGDKDSPLKLTVENIIADVSSIGGRIPTHQGAPKRLALAD